MHRTVCEGYRINFSPTKNSVMLAPVLLVLLAVLVAVSGHARWKCPTPRDALDVNGNHITFDNTGNKEGACGPQSGNWGFGKVTSLKPGWTTLVWEESISHTGGPFRLAILDENEVAKVVLLDHIPHNDESSPDNKDESTFQPYKMTVFIPDIDCKKCSLQLLYVMTDKTVMCHIPTCYYNPADSACKGSTDPNARTCLGAPNHNVCVQPNECFSNYHSCSDVVITGTRPLTDYPFNSQPFSWAYNNLTMSYYTKEIGSWQNGWLQGVNAEFTQDLGTVGC